MEEHTPSPPDAWGGFLAIKKPINLKRDKLEFLLELRDLATNEFMATSATLEAKPEGDDDLPALRARQMQTAKDYDRITHMLILLVEDPTNRQLDAFIDRYYAYSLFIKAFTEKVFGAGSEAERIQAALAHGISVEHLRALLTREDSVAKARAGGTNA